MVKRIRDTAKDKAAYWLFSKAGIMLVGLKISRLAARNVEARVPKRIAVLFAFFIKLMSNAAIVSVAII